MRISRSHLNLSLRVTWTWEGADNSFRQLEHISPWKTECTTIRSTRYEVANKLHQNKHSIYKANTYQLTWPMGWMDFRTWMNLALELECGADCASKRENPPDRRQTKLCLIWGMGKNTSVWGVEKISAVGWIGLQLIWSVSGFIRFGFSIEDTLLDTRGFPKSYA